MWNVKGLSLNRPVTDDVPAPRRKPRRISRWLAVLLLLSCGVALWFLPNVPYLRALERWPAADSGWEPWKPLAGGIDITRAQFSMPRLIKAHAIRIDLQEPGLQIVVKGGNGQPDGQTFSEYASDFLRREKVQVAVTACSFTPDTAIPGTTVRLDNLGIADSKVFSPQAANLDSLLILPGLKARMYRHGDSSADHNRAVAGVGGMWITLNKGTNVAEDLSAESASVSGVSADGRFLYWLVVDGRQPGYSEGATPAETADLIKGLGASDALNMDGGSMVTLVTAGGWRGYHLVNSPSHPVWPGLQRPGGSFIGFKNAHRP